MDAELTARRGLIDQLIEGGLIRSDRVLRAFERVRRSAFIPDAPLEEVYADRTHTVAEDDGVKVSTVSAPSMQAKMLELVDPAPGEDVLEIGSGGTNAALLAEMVAPGGSVWTVDIDERVIERARASLTQHPTPVPVRADVVDAWAPGTAITEASFDLVEFTVDTWTFPEWLLDVLRPGARVVAPLSLFECGWAFTFDEGRLRGTRVFTGGFVAARGAGASGTEPRYARAGDIWLARDQDADDGWLSSVLAREGESVETGLRLTAGSLYSPVILRLFAGSESAGTIRSESQSREHGFPGAPWTGTPVWLADDGLAVMDNRRVDGGVEVFVRAFGDDGADLAQRMAERLRTWRQDVGEPVCEAIPVSAVREAAPEGVRVIRRGAWEFRLSWER
ncbi:hypothetical protein L2X99_04070 [Microbacterium sp. KUDC0406]|uniref:hypothetical protein n=1 Tax=Microbacterium sp. KUDC0406 TaxID=2909588 RepID=UPI001F467FBE|nr:hypothetical protein [Microbacterium sp. KUDC0406]UJP10820.1 hypothetical protein L2X99_04070 [Microbacterium sp. KUDC0406]